MTKHQRVAGRVLKMFGDAKLDGLTILQAVGLITVGFYVLYQFEQEEDRLKEFDNWTAQVRARLVSELAAKQPQSATLAGAEPAGRA